MLFDAFSMFGAFCSMLVCLKVAVFVVRNLRMFLIQKKFNYHFTQFGKYAVITGATDGIGKAYCEEFARDGMNIVLISRSQKKLQIVAAEIEEKFNVKTKVIAADFTNDGEIYKDIREQLIGLEVGVLVNNVGMSYLYPSVLGDLEDAEKVLPDLVNCNCLSMLMMTYIVLPQMVKRGRGLVINISSAAALSPHPLLAGYSASKVFMDFLSRGLQAEYADKGIIIQSVLPFYVATKLAKKSTSSLTIPTPSEYVRTALKTVGVESVTCGCFTHNVQGVILSWLPEFLRIRGQLIWFQRRRKRLLKNIVLGKFD